MRFASSLAAPTGWRRAADRPQRIAAVVARPAACSAEAAVAVAPFACGDDTRRRVRRLAGTKHIARTGERACVRVRGMSAHWADRARVRGSGRVRERQCLARARVRIRWRGAHGNAEAEAVVQRRSPVESASASAPLAWRRRQARPEGAFEAGPAESHSAAPHVSAPSAAVRT